ncbi:MAG: hypothetical protein AAF039_13565 [Bacteroidota bacterium]
MKTKFLVLFISIAFFSSCSDDEDGENVFDGSTSSLQDLFSDEVVQALNDLNFSINEGTNPPNLEGTFFISQVILTDTNVESDNIGSRFFDQRYTFFDQNNSNNTIDFDGEQLNIDGSLESTLQGTGSFISGSDNSFSIFLVVLDENIESGAQAEIAYSISGTITSEGIANFEVAIIMLDNMGNPTGEFIDNGLGRRFLDSDGFSELLSDPSAIDYKVRSEKSEMSTLEAIN